MFGRKSAQIMMEWWKWSGKLILGKPLTIRDRVECGLLQPWTDKRKFAQIVMDKHTEILMTWKIGTKILFSFDARFPWDKILKETFDIWTVLEVCLTCDVQLSMVYRLEWGRIVLFGSRGLGWNILICWQYFSTLYLIEIVWVKRWYQVHPIIHCSLWDFLYRWSCEAIVIKHT